MLASLVLSLVACGGGSSGNDGGTPDDPNAACGNGKKEGSEACDDGNIESGDGCSGFCTQVESGWTCAEQGKPCYRTPVCGNGILETTETCDDRDTTAGDGCSASCQEENGWLCPKSGGRCRAKECGDGIIAGDEECEDGNAAAGDGCGASCRLEPGYKCEQLGQPCVRIRCGDGKPEGTEQCDDGNNNMGDGCSPLCIREPDCEDGVCKAVCGDGVMLPNDTTEECDDGNTRANDGCSPTCKREEGFTCVEIKDKPPKTVDIPVVYRDFIGHDEGGHIDFQNANAGHETGIVKPQLDADGKPEYAKEGTTSANNHGTAPFYQWYRDTKDVNLAVVSTLTLSQLDGAPEGTYRYDNQAFFPLDDAGWVAAGKEPERIGGHNFSFTSETRYWFEYKETEKLEFLGDDDVWVFINGRLAVDIGGVHSARSGSVILKDDATKLGLTKGGIYEVAVFQAERHTDASSYRLTLTNFNTTRTQCTNNCGDGQVDSGEECDQNGNPGGYGQCAPGCVWSPRCGDKRIDTEYGEECDEGAPTRTCDATCKVIIG